MGTRGIDLGALEGEIRYSNANQSIFLWNEARCMGNFAHLNQGCWSACSAEILWSGLYLSMEAKRLIPEAVRYGNVCRIEDGCGGGIFSVRTRGRSSNSGHSSTLGGPSSLNIYSKLISVYCFPL